MGEILVAERGLDIFDDPRSPYQIVTEVFQERSEKETPPLGLIEFSYRVIRCFDGRITKESREFDQHRGIQRDGKDSGFGTLLTGPVTPNSGPASNPTFRSGTPHQETAQHEAAQLAAAAEKARKKRQKRTRYYRNRRKRLRSAAVKFTKAARPQNPVKPFFGAGQHIPESEKHIYFPVSPVGDVPSPNLNRVVRYHPETPVRSSEGNCDSVWEHCGQAFSEREKLPSRFRPSRSSVSRSSSSSSISDSE